MEENTVKQGDVVAYMLDGKPIFATVLEVYENLDIRTDRDGVRTRNEYVKCKKGNLGKDKTIGVSPVAAAAVKSADKGKGEQTIPKGKGQHV